MDDAAGVQVLHARRDLAGDVQHLAHVCRVVLRPPARPQEAPVYRRLLARDGDRIRVALRSGQRASNRLMCTAARSALLASAGGCSINRASRRSQEERLSSAQEVVESR